MQRSIMIVPVAWRSEQTVQVVLEADTTLAQLKDRVRRALGAAGNDPVSPKQQ